MDDLEYIINLDIMQRAFRNKTKEEIKQLLTSIADEEAIAINNKSS